MANGGGNIYQTARKSAGLTQEAAAERLWPSPAAPAGPPARTPAAMRRTPVSAERPETACRKRCTSGLPHRPLGRARRPHRPSGRGSGLN